MIGVARQGPGSVSNLAKYLSPWGLFKQRLKAIAWCGISRGSTVINTRVILYHLVTQV